MGALTQVVGAQAHTSTTEYETTPLGMGYPEENPGFAAAWFPSPPPPPNFHRRGGAPVYLEDITFMNGIATNLFFFFRFSSRHLADKKKGQKFRYLSPAASPLEQIFFILLKHLLANLP